MTKVLYTQIAALAVVLGFTASAQAEAPFEKQIFGSTFNHKFYELELDGGGGESILISGLAAGYVDSGTTIKRCTITYELSQLTIGVTEDISKNREYYHALVGAGKPTEGDSMVFAQILLNQSPPVQAGFNLCKKALNSYQG